MRTLAVGLRKATLSLVVVLLLGTPTGAQIIRGDVNCDGAVSSVDGLFVLQFDVGLRLSSTQCPPPAGSLFQPACDANADGACNSVDGLFILQCDVGISN